MAISNLIPVFERVQRPNLRVISSNFNVDKLRPKKFLILVISVFVLCFLLQALISLWVTSDAFVLQDLKREKNIVQDEKDAILIKLNDKSSPDALAAAARTIGMKPAESISYVNVGQG